MEALIILIVFFPHQGNDIPLGLRQPYDYVNDGRVGGNLAKKIDEAVIKGRNNEIWRTQFMKERIILQDARDEGREEGIEKERTDVIIGMLQRGKSVDEIVDFCQYPYDFVKSIDERLTLTAGQV